MGCHSDGDMIHWIGSMHEAEEVACTVVMKYTRHRTRLWINWPSRISVLHATREPARRHFRASSHPLRFGEMTCTDCHNPHDGANDYLLTRSTINDTCYTCHAEKRGPFLWEHAPVTEDCTLCHNAHGSNHAGIVETTVAFTCASNVIHPVDIPPRPIPANWQKTHSSRDFCSQSCA